jgi:tetratricopeptide (TPR) repeat protein
MLRPSLLAAALALFSFGCGGSRTATRPAPSATADAAQAAPASAPLAVVAPPKGDRESYDKGLKAFQAGDWDKAASYFEDSVEDNPNDADAYFNLGAAQEKAGQLDKAETSYMAAQKIAPNHVPSVLNLGRLYQLRGDGDLALSLYEDAVKRTEGEAQAQVLAQLSAALRLKKKWDRSEEVVRRALALSPDLLDAHQSLALLYLDMGKPRLAEVIAQNALKLNDADAGLHNSLGLIYLRMGEKTGAWREFQRSISIDANYVPGYLNLGGVALSHRDYVSAEKAYRKAMSLEPSSYSARIGVAYALDGQKGREAAKGVAAGEAFERALELRPQNVDAVCRAGLAYGAIKAGWDRAKPFLSRCLSEAEGESRKQAHAKLQAIAAMMSQPEAPTEGPSDPEKKGTPAPPPEGAAVRKGRPEN